MQNFFLSFLNFSLLLGLGYLKGRTPLKVYVFNRQKLIKERLECAQKALLEAQNEHTQSILKLEALEIDRLYVRNQMDLEIAGFKKDFNAQAAQMSSIVLGDAQCRAQGLLAELKEELVSWMAEKVFTHVESDIQKFRKKADKADKADNEDYAQWTQLFIQQIRQDIQSSPAHHGENVL